MEAHQEQIKTRERNARNAMIITYNHEINNPLAIARGAIKRYQTNKEDKFIDMAFDALMRIEDIVIKIQEISQKDVEYEDYLSSKSLMMKLKKSE